MLYICKYLFEYKKILGQNFANIIVRIENVEVLGQWNIINNRNF